jgi:hypothetical protein
MAGTGDTVKPQGRFGEPSVIYSRRGPMERRAGFPLGAPQPMRVLPILLALAAPGTSGRVAAHGSQIGHSALPRCRDTTRRAPGEKATQTQAEVGGYSCGSLLVAGRTSQAESETCASRMECRGSPTSQAESPRLCGDQMVQYPLSCSWHNLCQTQASVSLTPKPT